MYKFYFIFFLLICVFSIFSFFVEPFNFLDVVSIPFMIMSLIGLFGYTYKRQFINKKFWKIYFFILIAFDISYLIASFLLKSKIHSDLNSPTAIFFILLISLPLYIAIFRYYRNFEKISDQENVSLKKSLKILIVITTILGGFILLGVLVNYYYNNKLTYVKSLYKKGLFIESYNKAQEFINDTSVEMGQYTLISDALYLQGKILVSKNKQDLAFKKFQKIWTYNSNFDALSTNNIVNDLLRKSRSNYFKKMK